MAAWKKDELTWNSIWEKKKEKKNLFTDWTGSVFLLKINAEHKPN